MPAAIENDIHHVQTSWAEEMRESQGRPSGTQCLIVSL